MLDNAKFTSEEALVSRNRGLVRKPPAIERNFLAICSDHGEVWVAKSGHHISSTDTVGYEADLEWQPIAFAARNIDRKF
jgi:hypothetical protein